jgi:hypothetical protein
MYRLSGLAITCGALIWLVRFATILASAGKATASGVSSFLYDLGLVLLLGGIVGIVLYFTRYLPRVARITAGVLSPLAFFFLLVFVDFLAGRLVPQSWPTYVANEAGIAATAVLLLVVGLGLVYSRRLGWGAP